MASKRASARSGSVDGAASLRLRTTTERVVVGPASAARAERNRSEAIVPRGVTTTTASSRSGGVTWLAGGFRVSSRASEPADRIDT